MRQAESVMPSDEKGPRSFVRDVGTISAITLLSRVLGLVRDCACAAAFGVGPVWDAFSFAFRVPNLFRRLFGEGALSAAFVPAFTGTLELEGKEAACRLGGRVVGTLAVALVLCLALGEGMAIGLLRWGGLPERWRLTLGLTAVLLPYMLLICLTAVAGAALNSMRHFAAPAAAPVVLNLIWIAAVLGVAPRVAQSRAGQAYVVSVAILVAGAFQLCLQAAVLRAKGCRFPPAFAPLHPQVRQMARAMAPVAIGLAALQINVLLDGVLAISLAGPSDQAHFTLFGAAVRYPMVSGANSVLYYANRLMQLPLGVFGIALATAAFPRLSAHAARQDWARFSESLVRSLGLALFVAVPSGIGLIVLRYPAIELVFGRGAFAAVPGATARTAAVLAAYSAGMWAYCALHVLTRAFYSMGQPGVPARVAGYLVAVNLALNLLLVWPLREAGLAAATALCAGVQAAVLYLVLGRRIRLRGQRRLALGLLKTLGASAGMALACVGTLGLLPPSAAHDGLLLRLARAGLPIATGGGVFVTLAALLRMEQLRALLPGARSATRT